MPTTLPSPLDRGEFRFVTFNAAGAEGRWIDGEMIWVRVGEVRRAAASPHFSPGAVMIAEDFGPVRVLATESIAGTTVEGARARTGPKDPRGRGQRSPQSARSSTSRSTS